ncbi:TetR/AcrR family transcriptional regulator [Amycolatopsis sp. H20-H5]|uniref:TetR/AcrR family transcriptional regulator n=1 Tax=Amycolatopsis sp. H20-H5 TaxID=3046309 RepID=UPI002DBC8113|nr:TetR/AcrR family transcriptional regulator C-terminal domain-containing protein [Amycolatopsis sp. H20-H5]MEC3980025.1 TetR/AcrR family transcriptional regulator C-terminal domain-containing protein [Amycolatopsis sp. H20-H5]
MSDHLPEDPVQAVRTAPRKGRPPILDRTGITEAAIAIGFEELSMSRVAAVLKVRHSALYRYFPSRDLLVAAAIDRIAAGVDWPEPVTAEQFRPRLHATFHTLWTVLGAHPGLAKETSAARFSTNKLLSRFDVLPLELVEIGFGPTDALYAVYSTLHFTLGSAIMSEDARTLGPESGSRRPLAENSAAWTDARTHDAFATMIGQSAESWFATQLDLVLDGVCARLRS